MTTKERFLRAFRHEEADRVPITDSPWNGTLARWRREGMPANADWREYFGAAQFYTLHPAYKCNCSRNYIEGILAGMGAAELRSIIAEQGKIEVHCHYCNTDYVFTPAETEQLIARTGGGTT